MTVAVERMLPLYEAKMLDSYDHRDADIVRSPTAEKRQNQPRYLSDAEEQDALREPLPAAWVREEALPDHLAGWQTGFCNITSATNERTMRAAAIPGVGVGDMFPLFYTADRPLLLAIFNSFVFDYVARVKVAGLHLSYFYLNQIPVPPPAAFENAAPWGEETLKVWVRRRVIALSCTSWSLGPMATELTGRSLVWPWDPARRELIRAELDAAMFHVYGLSREDADFVMETFSTLKRKNEATHGEYRTKRIILEIYDAMQRAVDSGVPYEPIVDLPPLETSPDGRTRP